MEKENGEPNATYKLIPEKTVEEEAVSRPKSLVKMKSDGEEVDGADEKMLPEQEEHKIEGGDGKETLNEKQNGDAKLDIGESKKPFGGLDKEELMKYANDPFWVRLRWFLFITFWLLWAAMLFGAIMIIYSADKCEPPAPRTWWQEGPLTELEPDSEPEQLNLLDKGIKGVIVSWLEDAYKKIDESHNVAKLITEINKLNVKTIVDLDPSTSDIWFENSENDSNGNYSNYYIWRAPKGTGNGALPAEQYPNNWINFNNKSSWKYSEKRKQFYYAPQDKPFLNFHNDIVVSEFSSAIRNFISLGASGIRIRNAPYLMVDPKFEDETVSNTRTGEYKLGEYRFYLHNKTENWPELGNLLNRWKKEIRNLTVDGPFMVKEELPKTYIESYKVKRNLVVDLPVKSRIFDKNNVTEIVHSLTYTRIDVDWPLWKLNSSSPIFPQDVLDIVTYLLPGACLVDQNFKIDKELQQIRESPSIMRGIFRVYGIGGVNKTALAYIRVTSGNPGFLVLLNAQNTTVTVNIQQEVPDLSKVEEVTIQLYSKNYMEPQFMGKGEKKKADMVPLSPKSVLVLSYVPPKED